MTGKLQITFRNTDSSPAVEAEVQRRAEWLQKYCDQLHSCRVLIEAPAGNHRHGGEFHVVIDMTVPGAELVVRRDPGIAGAHTDVYVAIRDAFHAARRELVEFTSRRAGPAARRVGIPRSA